MEEFRALLQVFIRRFGLLQAERTPCGQPLVLSDAHALMILRTAGAAGLPQATLAAGLGVDKSTASRLVVRLTKSGHLEPAPAPDGRQRPVRLTIKGARLAETIDTASRERFAALLAGVPAGRRDGVVGALRDIVAALARLEESHENSIDRSARPRRRPGAGLGRHPAAPAAQRRDGGAPEGADARPPARRAGDHRRHRAR